MSERSVRTIADEPAVATSDDVAAPELMSLELLRRARLQGYASMAKLGLHVGSGVTAAACKTLIAARTKRSGQRWRKPGVEAVLTVRSPLESERVDGFGNASHEAAGAS